MPFSTCSICRFALLPSWRRGFSPAGLCSAGSPAGIGLIRTIRALRQRAYDVAIDLQGLIKSAVLARLSGARRVIGFARHALREPSAAIMYTETVDPGTYGHVIQKNVALLSALAKPDRTPRG